jgi:hypothetical protein
MCSAPRRFIRITSKGRRIIELGAHYMIGKGLERRWRSWKVFDRAEYGDMKRKGILGEYSGECDDGPKVYVVAN